MAQSLNALIPMGVQVPDYGNTLAKGIEMGNALLDAPVNRRLKQAQAEYYGRPDAQSSVYGTPIWGTDDNGVEGIGVIGKDGSFRLLDTGSFNPSRGVTMENLGTSILPTSKVTGAPAGAPLPIDNTGRASAEKSGTLQGQAQADLPKAESAAERLLNQVEGVQNDPNLGNVTGWQAYLPTFQSKNVDVEAKIRQLGGGAFLQAFESLKGGGQITEVEGQKATEALARLTELRQSDEGFVQALEDFKGEVVRLRDLARTRAAGGAPQYKLPPGVTYDQLKAWVQEAKASGVTDEQIRAKMLEMGIDPDQ